MNSEINFIPPHQSAQRFDIDKLTKPKQGFGVGLPNQKTSKENEQWPTPEQISSQQEQLLETTNDKSEKKDVRLVSGEEWNARRADNITGAPEFMSSGILQESVKAHYENAKEDKLKQEKREILDLLDSNDLEKITDFIINEADNNQAFQLEMQRVKNEYGEQLASVDFLAQKDWKIFTVMELYHKETFLHQIRSMLELLDCLKIGSPLLAKEIADEDVPINQLAIAAGLHDFGKLGIPKFILDFKVKDEVWTYHFMNLPFKKQQEIFQRRFPKVKLSAYEFVQLMEDHERLHEFFEENEFYAVSEVPIEAVISEEQKQILKSKNIDGSVSLKKIIQPHEKYSEIYLKKLKYDLEALIAGNHHDNNTETSEINKYPVSQSTLKFIVELLADIVHFFDVRDALTSHREYMNEKTFTEALVLTIDQPYKRPHAAAILANYQMQKFLDDKDNLKEILTNPERVKRINEFIKKHLPKEERLYYENEK